MTNPLLAKVIEESTFNMMQILEELAITWDELAKSEETIIDLERSNVRRILLDAAQRIAYATATIQEVSLAELEEYARKALSIPALR